MQKHADRKGWLDIYLWLEIYSRVATILQVTIVSLAGIAYLEVLKIPLWFGPQILIPPFTASTVFFLGVGPHRPSQILSVRSRVYSILSLVGSICGFAACWTFFGISIAKYTTAASSCGGLCTGKHGGVLAFVLTNAALLAIVYGVNIYGIIYSWLNTSDALKSKQ